ncbi:hypothetical protein D3C73_1501890 [compost metagenome]
MTAKPPISTSRHVTVIGNRVLTGTQLRSHSPLTIPTMAAMTAMRIDQRSMPLGFG